LSEEPASDRSGPNRSGPYRSGSAAFELHVGSALKAILPGAFQGAVIGSLVVAAYSVFATGAAGFAASDIVGAVMMFCFIMMIGTMAGMIACGIYITLVGLPLALLMRRRIATRAMLVVTLVVSTIVGLIAGSLLIAPLWGTQDDGWLMMAMALCYAIPAGLAYRRAIMTERLLSFWSTDAD